VCEFPWIHFAFSLVVDTCVLQPPIATSGETTSASQVLPKGLVVRACWCIVRVEPWVCPCANKCFDLMENIVDLIINILSPIINSEDFDILSRLCLNRGFEVFEVLKELEFFPEKVDPCKT
jgi:hypothetical protein